MGEGREEGGLGLVDGLESRAPVSGASAIGRILAVTSGITRIGREVVIRDCVGVGVDVG